MFDLITCKKPKYCTHRSFEIKIYFVAMKCFGVSIGSILNSSIVLSVYRAVVFFGIFDSLRLDFCT